MEVWIQQSLLDCVIKLWIPIRSHFVYSCFATVLTKYKIFTKCCCVLVFFLVLNYIVVVLLLHLSFFNIFCFDFALKTIALHLVLVFFVLQVVLDLFKNTGRNKKILQVQFIEPFRFTKLLVSNCV